MALYSGTCDSLVQLGCYENNSIYHPRMAGALVSGQTPGDTVWVRIWESTNNGNGMLQICLSSLELVQCPSLFKVSGGGGYCQGDSGVSITLSGSEPGFLYTLLLTDTIRQDTLPGTGDTLTWSEVGQEGTYRIVAHHTVDSCTKLMSDSAVVIIHDIPDLSFDAVSSSCFEHNDGTIATSVTDGAEPYQAEWSGTGGFTSTLLELDHLAPGDFHYRT